MSKRQDEMRAEAVAAIAADAETFAFHWSISKWPQTYCPRCNACGDSRKCRVCKFTKFPKSGPANMHKWEGTWPAR